MSYLIDISSTLRLSTPGNYLYHGFDSESTHQLNKDRLGPEWQYYNLPIDYRLNKQGYRMSKSLDDINFNNYIAFFGCSFTFGLGLAVEDTFAYKISKRMNCDYVNASLSGGSPSFVDLNIFQMFKSVPKLPKMIIVNWPSPYRTHYWYKNILVRMLPLPPQKITDPLASEAVEYWKHIYEKTIMEESNSHNTFFHIKNRVTTLCKVAGVKLFQLSTLPFHNPVQREAFFNEYPDIKNIPEYYKNCTNDLYNNVELLNRMVARDVRSVNNSFPGHPGIEYQEDIVNAFFKEYPELDTLKSSLGDSQNNQD